LHQIVKSPAEPTGERERRRSKRDLVRREVVGFLGEAVEIFHLQRNLLRLKSQTRRKT
jgi:hypothetical protein